MWPAFLHRFKWKTKWEYFLLCSHNNQEHNVPMSYRTATAHHSGLRLPQVIQYGHNETTKLSYLLVLWQVTSGLNWWQVIHWTILVDYINVHALNTISLDVAGNWSTCFFSFLLNWMSVSKTLFRDNIEKSSGNTSLSWAKPAVSREKHFLQRYITLHIEPYFSIH